MSKDYKTSVLYQQGLFHKELSELLLDPNTEIGQIAEFGIRWNYDVRFQLQVPTNTESE